MGEQVLVENLTDCEVLVGVSCSTVWLRNCTNCKFNVACQQLRVSSSSNCEISLFSSIGPVFDASHHITVRPFQPTYVPLQKRHFKAAGIELSQNNWNKIEDQDATNASVPYPR